MEDTTDFPSRNLSQNPDLPYSLARPFLRQVPLSLWDMLKFNAYAFHASITLLTQLLIILDASYEADGFTPAKEYCIHVPGEQMDDASLHVVKMRVKNLKKALRPLDVPATKTAVSRLLRTLENKYINFGE